MKKFFLIGLFCFGFLIKPEAQEEKYIGLFVYNFTKYFEWPNYQEEGDFVIQVMGHKSVYDELAKITIGKTVGTKQIRVEHITGPDQLNPECHILFLGHWQTRHINTIRTKIKNKPILLITEFEGLLQKGSAINFVIRNGTIKFELHKSNARAAGLKTAPRLESLAYTVVD
jgi:hypothetical protein